jgi:hypothetical protein
MRRPVAVFDANVLYPAFLRDLLVRLALGGTVAPRWTEQIHEEWMRNVLAKHQDLDRDRLLRTRDLMERAAPGALVEGYERHVGRIRLPDPDDRHAVAAAIEAGADLIVTFNLRDFPSDVLDSFGLVARHPDPFVVDCWSALPDPCSRPCVRSGPDRSGLRSRLRNTSSGWRKPDFTKRPNA